MCGKNLKFVNNKIEKLKFHSSKSPISWMNFIGYKNDEVIALLCIVLSKMSGFVRVFDKSKNMNFLIKKKLLSKKDKKSGIKSAILWKNNW